MTSRSNSGAVVIAMASALTMALASGGRALAAADPCNAGRPAGAQALGYSKQLFCVVPTVADIAGGDTETARLYSGKWYDKNEYPRSLYSNASPRGLSISNGGIVSTQTRKSRPGALPLLRGADGFYVEFGERISDNDADHFPAVWLMPQEHNAARADHAAGDPDRFERWMELDVDEGGYHPGHHGAMILWSGVSPSYQDKKFPNDPKAGLPADRTEEHVFGLSYDPAGKQVTWWLDGKNVGSVSTAEAAPVVDSHNYYLIMSNQHHGKNKPYQMVVTYFQAWSGR